MNEVFLKRMSDYLKDEYAEYIQTLQEDAYRGLRLNTAKIRISDFLELSIGVGKVSCFCSEAFSIPATLKGLGNHPAHLAGLFYVQEPSASSAVEILDVKQGDWVLDLCAAPGGKSTQIAAKLNGTGMLISNEIEHKRAMILLSNMERLGFSECMITSDHPKDLCKETQGWFDKVLVDAPCSGEGMFKKHSKAMQDWSMEHVKACATRQSLILESAYTTLKENGVLVYSTCTYSMEENEAVIYNFLQVHRDMELMDTGVRFGRGGFAYKDLDVSKVRRIFPMDQGEGHFVAKMKKKSVAHVQKKQELKNAVLPTFVEQMIEQQLGELMPYYMVLQDKVYSKTTPFLTFQNVHIVRQGTLCGEIIKNRMEPHQHFYTSIMHAHKFQQVYDMSDEQCQSYIRGNLLQVANYKGYTALTWKGYVMGFAKGDGTVLKNKYPKGMRVRGL